MALVLTERDWEREEKRERRAGGVGGEIDSSLDFSPWSLPNFMQGWRRRLKKKNACKGTKQMILENDKRKLEAGEGGEGRDIKAILPGCLVLAALGKDISRHSSQRVPWFEHTATLDTQKETTETKPSEIKT